MAHAENSVVVKKPVEEVYEFVADGMNNPRWRPGVLDIQLHSGTPGTVGAVYKQGMKGPGGRRIDGDYRITAAEPNKELSFVVVTGPARPEGHYYFESGAEGTKLRFVLDFQPRGFAKLMNGMIQKTMQAEVANLSNLKRILEAT